MSHGIFRKFLWIIQPDVMQHHPRDIIPKPTPYVAQNSVVHKSPQKKFAAELRQASQINLISKQVSSLIKFSN